MTVSITLRSMGEIDIYTAPDLHLSDHTIASLSALDEADERDGRNRLDDQLDHSDRSKGKPCGSEMKDIEDMAALLAHLHADKLHLRVRLIGSFSCSCFLRLSCLCVPAAFFTRCS